MAFVRQRFSQKEFRDIQEAVLCGGGERCLSGEREAGDQKLLQKSGHKVAMAAQTIAKAAGAKREWKQGTDFTE